VYPRDLALDRFRERERVSTEERARTLVAEGYVPARYGSGGYELISMPATALMIVGAEGTAADARAAATQAARHRGQRSQAAR
jgi:hypothetical protein